MPPDLTVEQAIANLQQRDDLSLRYYAAWWLGKFRVTDPVAIDALIEALSDDQDRAPDGGFPLRRNAARALGKLGDRRAVSPLIDCLSCPDYYVREAAAQALEELGDPTCIPHLVDLLKREEVNSPPVAGKATMTQPYDSILEALGTLGAIAERETIQAFLEHSVPRVQYAAARALYQLTQDSIYGERLVAALQGKDLQLRRAALMDLGASGYVAAAPAIANALAENSLKLIALKGLLEHQLQQDSMSDRPRVSGEAIAVMEWMDTLL
ncbi:MAG: HEAT repeat domain-containing protein [Synechococcales cyanobacterium T60_A2020_003]|nr:HEAT repeat domain-containing protein [Synechococcales cyanobacterium T60_A2020_003]